MRLSLQVSLYDSDPGQLTKVLPDVSSLLDGFQKEGVLKGKLSPKRQLELISVTSDLKECLKVHLKCHRHDWVNQLGNG
jgi:hypothetical protein